MTHIYTFLSHLTKKNPNMCLDDIEYHYNIYNMIVPLELAYQSL